MIPDCATSRRPVQAGPRECSSCRAYCSARFKACRFEGDRAPTYAVSFRLNISIRKSQRIELGRGTSSSTPMATSLRSPSSSLYHGRADHRRHIVIAGHEVPGQHNIEAGLVSALGDLLPGAVDVATAARPELAPRKSSRHLAAGATATAANAPGSTFSATSRETRVAPFRFFWRCSTSLPVVHGPGLNLAATGPNAVSSRRSTADDRAPHRDGAAGSGDPHAGGARST
jgi:hypothetical protein